MATTGKVSHTPGPFVAVPPPKKGGHWSVCARGDRPPPHPNSPGWLVAKIGNGAPGDTLETEGANARLFAAAPAMLAELRDVAASLDLVAEQCERWAAESRSGGWSTHQVDAHRRKAAILRDQAAHVRAVIAAAEPS